MQRDQTLVSTPSELSPADQDKIVVRLTQENFASFVTENQYTIIWASHDAKPSAYPFGLVGQFGLSHAPAVRMGLVRLSKVDWNPAVQLYIRMGLEKLKLKPDDNGRPPHGFYLLAKGIPIGFCEGAVDLSKDEEDLGPAVMFGLLTTLLTGEGKAGWTVGNQIAGRRAGARMAKEFERLIQQHEAALV